MGSEGRGRSRALDTGSMLYEHTHRLCHVLLQQEHIVAQGTLELG